MSTVENKDIATEVENSVAENIQESGNANNPRSDSRRTQETWDMQKVSSLENKVQNLGALLTDLNNKLNTVQTANINQENYEFPRKDESSLDARTKALKKEWGLN